MMPFPCWANRKCEVKTLAFQIRFVEVPWPSGEREPSPNSGVYVQQSVGSSPSRGTRVLKQDT